MPKDIDRIKKEIEGRTLWPYVEGAKLLKRYNYDTEHTYTFESGFGPSGFPHIGTFGEVVRTGFIISALKEFGFKTKLIAFSDDLDGLRKVPEGMPEWLKDHLGRPVSAIPDPFGEEESFSAHMNGRLKNLLDWIGVDYQFISSKEAYESGLFDEGIKTLLANTTKLESIILPTLSEETRKNWHPFFPICEKCGRNLTTTVTNINLNDYTIDYICGKDQEVIKGCGHQGTQTALAGHGKMTWRVDWPLRWQSLKIDYELYGKDLIDSFTVGKKIMGGIFNAKGPENMFYEMFLDEDGTKISKSKGKGLTVESWLKYGTLESINLLMYRKPRKAKELSYRIIPTYVDDVTSIHKDYEVRGRPAEHDFNFIRSDKSDGHGYPDVSYMLVCNLMAALKSTDREIIKSYLTRQTDIADKHLEGTFLEELIAKGKAYYEDFVSASKEPLNLSPADISLLKEVIDMLKVEQTAEEIHDGIYEIAKKNNALPKDLFRTLYLVLIDHSRGPRLGGFIKMIGEERAAEVIKEKIAEADKAGL
ncbi:MAG: lysine--tRNA ligase [Nitrospinota bacterium]